MEDYREYKRFRTLKEGESSTRRENNPGLHHSRYEPDWGPGATRVGHKHS
jgi:hypothetical protein